MAEEKPLPQLCVSWEKLARSQIGEFCPQHTAITRSNRGLEDILLVPKWGISVLDTPGIMRSNKGLEDNNI